MAGLVRNAASRMKVHINITDTGDSIIVKVINEIPHTNQVAIVGQPIASALAQTH